MNTSSIVYPHVSVDCVVLGFDGNRLNVLLLKRVCNDGESLVNDLKLPGSLIFADEDLDEAAERVIGDLFSGNAVYLKQFKSFGSPGRTSSPRDIGWLENAIQQKIGRIVTVAYLALHRIDNKMKFRSQTVEAVWVPLTEIRDLAFDHERIIREAVEEVKNKVSMDASLVFNLLPAKFTASQMRVLFEEIYGEKMDVRNFHKKMSRMEFIVPLEEFERNVSHRAARFFKFDKKTFSKIHSGF